MAHQPDKLPLIPRGQRAVLAGKTGSGKTTLARWLLRRSPGSWIILNTKYDRGFAKLPESVTIESFDFRKIEPLFQQYRFIIVNPPKEFNNPQLCDEFISVLHDHYENIGLYVDELYQLHTQGRAGPGLVGWLTRGRSLNQSFIGATQRPKWVSKFVFSEAEYLAILALNLFDDRKYVYEFVGDDRVLDNPPQKHAWRWYDVGADTLTLYSAVPKEA